VFWDQTRGEGVRKTPCHPRAGRFLSEDPLQWDLHRNFFSYVADNPGTKAGIRHVQELLGHQSLQSTVVYTRVGVEDLREVLQRAHPRERLWRRRE